MKWCIYLKDNQVISDMFECEESMLENGSSITVQMSDDPEVLKRTMNFFATAKVRFTTEVIEQIRRHRTNNEWLKIAEIVHDKTGVSPCCQGAIEKMIAGI